MYPPACPHTQHTHTHTHTHLRTHAHTQVSVSLSFSLCLSVCLSVCLICVCVCVCVCLPAPAFTSAVLRYKQRLARLASFTAYIYLRNSRNCTHIPPQRGDTAAAATAYIHLRNSRNSRISTHIPPQYCTTGMQPYTSCAQIQQQPQLHIYTYATAATAASPHTYLRGAQIQQQRLALLASLIERIGISQDAPRGATFRDYFEEENGVGAARLRSPLFWKIKKKALG